MNRLARIPLATLFFVAQAYGLSVTGYTPEANNLYSSGYASAPVLNSGSSFIGAGLDFSGLAWSAADPTKNFVFLSPIHFSATRHYGGADTLKILGSDGALHTGTQALLQDVGVGVVLSGQTKGDMALGTLTAPISTQLPRYAVLDANSASGTNSPGNYSGATAILVGHGPNASSSTRIGTDTIAGYGSSGSNTYIATYRNNAQLEGGDSGAPAFYAWTNPNGERQLTLLGNNLGISSTYNVLNFIGTYEAINAHNALMTVDGYALRVAGPISAQWNGGAGPTGVNFNRTGNWSSGSVPGDVYVLFNGSSTSDRQITMNTAGNLRGLYFKATAGADGFTFAGSNALTIGRGGITNYDNNVQTFTANLVLGDHQYWDVGPGGVSANNINTNGKLLEIAGSGTATISGAISGSGGVALSGSRLLLSGSSSYTGRTWVHSGRATVNGNIAASSSVTVDAGASLGGSGQVSQLRGAGSIDPGNSPGILTADSIDPSGGLDFNFEFTLAGSPLYGNASASGNDLLRLTGTTPFTSSLTAINTINIYLNGAGNTFRGGFFTEGSYDLAYALSNANYAFFIASGNGAYIYNGTTYEVLSKLLLDLSIVSDTANFASGTVSGSTLQISLVPEPSSAALLALGALAFLRRRR